MEKGPHTETTLGKRGLWTRIHILRAKTPRKTYGQAVDFCWLKTSLTSARIEDGIRDGSERHYGKRYNDWMWVMKKIEDCLCEYLILMSRTLKDS